MDKDFFASNRAKLIEKTAGAPTVLTAAAKMQRTPDDAWQFEQEANFWYLSGVDEPDWLMILADGKTTLVAPDQSKLAKIFGGESDHMTIGKVSGADEIVTREAGNEILRNLSKKHDKVYTILPQNQIDHDFFLNPAQTLLAGRLRKLFKKTEDIKKEIHELRAIKTRDEIMMMRRAINLTVSAFNKVHGELANYTFEYEAQARFSYEFERVGATHAYDPIIASGKNACTLHYAKNRDGLKKDVLVLMDVGARYGGYCADITRTYAFGEASPRAKDVHKAVESAQKAIISLLKPGKEVAKYLDESDDIMREALKSLNLYKNEADFRKYYPHAISHGLGIDVHDPLGAPKIFQPGMVLTVEPGVYIPEESIGVRIEDDILITDSGFENLSGRLSADL